MADTLPEHTQRPPVGSRLRHETIGACIGIMVIVITTTVTITININGASSALVLTTATINAPTGRTGPHFMPASLPARTTPYPTRWPVCSTPYPARWPVCSSTTGLAVASSRVQPQDPRPDGLAPGLEGARLRGCHPAGEVPAGTAQQALGGAGRTRRG